VVTVVETMTVVETTSVSGAGKVVGEPDGLRGIVLGQLVTIPGCFGTHGAQMPTKYERAAWTSMSSPHDCTQAMTLATKVSSWQKQSLSLLSAQVVNLSHVFKHEGTTLGHPDDGAGDEGAGEE